MGSKQFWVLQKFGPRTFCFTKIITPKKLIKIGPVTAEIFLIWKNVARTIVARTNVAWTNVTVIVG